MKKLLYLLSIWPVFSFADNWLVTDCIISPGGEYFENGAHFVLAFNVEESSQAIYFAEENKLHWYASGGISAPFETNGGVWSLAMARDVLSSMLKLPFRHINIDTKSNLFISAAPPECEVDYSSIRDYESGNLRKTPKSNQ
ncbi:hypothetical protein J7384_10880 [Endozoicomonas sp. G2_1]|uniref:hypothetical protein n=1 Tax=Endozoicomonas sp. G2_1 TaxID=2821091 RepID=UPI001ADD445C|nr:hypothetical protein [Endozoicomonas sp. G2_1]MBO9490861.1 hypothetical protein [Endozoicomonas sp. G2_1]